MSRFDRFVQSTYGQTFLAVWVVFLAGGTVVGTAVLFDLIAEWVRR